MVINPVITQKAINHPALPTFLVMSALTIKMPEPIIEPATTIVASTKPSDCLNEVACCGAFSICSAMESWFFIQDKYFNFFTNFCYVLNSSTDLKFNYKPTIKKIPALRRGFLFILLIWFFLYVHFIQS